MNKAVFLDRDGVINRAIILKGKPFPPPTKEELEILPGVEVHEAVMANNELKTGCTVHFVNEYIDEGEIILQKEILINYNESPWELGGRVFREENKLLIEAISLFKESGEL